MPKVVVIAGPNGAGKSTAAPEVLKDVLQVGEFVNADVIAAGLPASRPGSVALRAGRTMRDRLHELVMEGRDFAFETTLASRAFAPWLKVLQAGGYVLHMLYLWLPSPDLALARVTERARRGGYAAAENTVRRRYERGLDNFLTLYSGFADSWVVMDNSSPGGPRVLESAATPAASDAGEALFERIVAAAAAGVREAVRDHKRAGNPIAVWRDSQVVWMAPGEIAD